MRIKVNLLFKLSYLSLNLELTLDYLYAASNKPALANILDFNTICDNSLCKQTQLEKSD